jgi:ribosome-binding protein aMBF1 (putative translation factor)
METSNPITEAIEIVGLSALASELGITYQAIRKWEKAGRMPRTEFTKETDYSKEIERLTKRKVTKNRLLEWGINTAA